jgi:hypothetical protein
MLLMVTLALSARAQAASEYALLTFTDKGIRYVDKNGVRDDGGKPDLFVEFSGENANRSKSAESIVLVLNGLSKKGWEVANTIGGNGGDSPTFLLRRDVAGNGAAPGAAPSVAPGGVPKAAAQGEKVPLTFTGGYDTDPRDGGRPVVLIAAGMGVTPEVFREAFSHVRPARGGEPEPGQVRQNKEALMNALGKYGLTNDRIDEVSNYYRYANWKGETWKHRPATGVATVKDGVVTGITITDPGAGYSSPPKVTVAGVNQTFTVNLSYSTDLEKNGSVKEVVVAK